MFSSEQNGGSECWDTLSDHLKNGIQRISAKTGMKILKTAVKPGSSKGDNFMGNLYKVKITGVEDEEVKVLNLMMKAINIPASNEERGGYFSDAYYREILAYSRLFPMLKQIEDEFGLKDDERFKYAKYYDSSTEVIKEWIVFEDISPSGFKMMDKFEEMDRDHVWIVIKEFAKFHALVFVLRQTNEVEYNRLLQDFMKNNNKYKKEYDNYLKVVYPLAADVLKDEDEVCRKKFNAFTEGATDKLFKLTDYPNDDRYSLLCHFDCWNNNFMFKYKDGKPTDVRILDWQQVKVASPVLDLVYLLAVNTGEKFRADYISEAFDFYYNSLSDVMKRLGHDSNILYPKNVYDEHLKIYMPMGLLVSVVTWPVTLTEKDDTVCLTDHLEDSSALHKLVKFSDVAGNRLKGLVRDLAKLEYI